MADFEVNVDTVPRLDANVRSSFNVSDTIAVLKQSLRDKDASWLVPRTTYNDHVLNVMTKNDLIYADSVMTMDPDFPHGSP